MIAEMCLVSTLPLYLGLMPAPIDRGRQDAASLLQDPCEPAPCRPTFSCPAPHPPSVRAAAWAGGGRCQLLRQAGHSGSRPGHLEAASDDPASLGAPPCRSTGSVIRQASAILPDLRRNAGGVSNWSWRLG